MTDPRALVPGRNCWRIETATRASVIVDAEGYFRIARQAMLSAKHQILLIGWDFDARIKLVHRPDDGAPAEVGAFIDWLVARNPAVQVHILRWDMGALKTLLRGRTLLTLVRWLFKRRIHLKLDSVHPTGASHHQKIVIIDDCLAFCGGIDMTDKRWDTRAHPDADPERQDAGGKSYQPWHDATTALAGPVAQALGELGRERWRRAGGRPIAPPPAVPACWPRDLPADFTQVAVAVSRTRPEMPGIAPIHEIEALYLDLIGRAERWIYAESQYFASRVCAEAIARRLEEPDGPEIVLLNPQTSHGWLEPIAMDTARARLIEAIRPHDRHGRLRVYHPCTAEGAPVYVHAKILVIDGRILRVGSSNFNNRSMRLDTECDVTIDATRPGNAPAADRIAAIAHELMAEHLGVEPEVVARRMAETGSLIATIEGLRGSGRSLCPYRTPELDGLQEWLADNEILDPEGPEEMFAPLAKRDLLKRLRGRLRR
ncbi:MAG TPA: phospholipase D-like domain-containing protein [Sphingomonas sp.]|nr:phospholipase D-like domain-containing protein [Sphingomonas sp.]